MFNKLLMELNVTEVKVLSNVTVPQNGVQK